MGGLTGMNSPAQRCSGIPSCLTWLQGDGGSAQWHRVWEPGKVAQR